MSANCTVSRLISSSPKVRRFGNEFSSSPPLSSLGSQHPHSTIAAQLTPARRTWSQIPRMHSDRHIEQRVSPVLPPAEVITPTKSRSRGLLTDLAGWSSYSDMRTQAPGSEDNDGLHQSGNVTSDSPSGKPHALQKSSHLPTPQSPGNRASYLFTSLPQDLQPDLESTALPLEFRSHASPSPPPFPPHSIPTPESSPLITRSRSNGPHSLSRSARASSQDDGDSATLSKRDGLQSRASTPPRTASRQTSTRPVTPVLQYRTTMPLQGMPTEQSPRTPSRLENSSPPLKKVKNEHDGVRRSAQGAEPRRPDYLKRTRRLAPSSGAGGGSSLTSDLASKDESLLWSSANVGVVESPIQGRRIALFQETSEESFEESLMAGGYGRYRSDRSWKVDEDTETVSNPLGDATGEGDLGSGMVLTEEEKRKKTRLAAFLDPPRVTPSTAQLFPVQIEGCGRVLLKVEPPEPQAPSKPTLKAKRTRKRKRVSVDMKQDMDAASITVPEDGSVDGPNWPDTEFPWRCRLEAHDGLSTAEREERLRHIESFFDRDSDRDDGEEGHSSSSQRSPEVGPLPQVPPPGRGKMYPLLSHSNDRRRGMTTLSVIPCDPADARSVLLSKKSIRATRLRLLRRRNTNRKAGSDGEVLCICRGRDDGRPLVQCDACRTWYHLECIGIQSSSELGKEEDPWFCANCAEVKTPPPVIVPLSEPMFVLTGDEHSTGERGNAGVEEYDPPFLNAGFNPSPAMTWTRSVRPPRTPPRTRYGPHTASGSSWDEQPSSSSRGEPRTPQLNSASGFGDMVRVYGMTPGCSLGTSSATTVDELPFDPTSTPSRGIRFGLPFTTPKDGRWGSPLWQGVRGTGNELFHTPKQHGEDGAATLRYGQPLLSHGRIGEVSEEGPAGMPGLYRTTGANNVTPIERDVSGGLKRVQIQALESPLGAKRSRRTVDS